MHVLGAGNSSASRPIFCTPNPALRFGGAVISSFAVSCSVAAAVPLIPPRPCCECLPRSAIASGLSAASPGGIDPLRASPSSLLQSRTGRPPAQLQVFHKTTKSSLCLWAASEGQHLALSFWRELSDTSGIGRAGEMKELGLVEAIPKGRALASALQQQGGVGSGSSSEKARQGRISNNSANIFRKSR